MSLPGGVALLDRDGTIIVERNYLADPKGVELLPNAACGLRELRALGFKLVLVTNQSGIGRGYFSVQTVDQIHQVLQDKLRAEDAYLDAVYVCPHIPEAGCSCRKPEPGLALQAAEELGFDPKLAVVIGDKPCDVDLAARIGAVSMLVKTGYGAAYLDSGAVHPDFVAEDLADAARLLGFVSVDLPRRQHSE